jgi:hypothetical protein
MECRQFITNGPMRPDHALNVKLRGCHFRISFRFPHAIVEPYNHSPAGRIPAEGELMGSAEAVQQFLLILVPALILILIDPAKRP